MTNEAPDQRGTPGAAGDSAAAAPPVTPDATGAADASITEVEVPAFQPAQGAAPTFTQPLFSVPPARTRRRITLTSMLLAAAAVIAVAGVAFAVGRVTAPASTTGSGLGGRTFANGGAGGANGNGFPGAAGGGAGGFLGGAAGDIQLSGTVTAVNGDTITLQLSNGRTIEVQTSSSTTYHTEVAGSASDVTNGKTVTVQVTGGSGLRDLFGRGTTSNGSVTVPAADVTVTGQ